VTVPHEVSDEGSVFVRALLALTSRDPRRLDDRAIVSHVVHNPNETVVENFMYRAQHLFHEWHDGTTYFHARLLRSGPLPVVS
jgi:hypothetical protein